MSVSIHESKGEWKSAVGSLSGLLLLSSSSWATTIVVDAPGFDRSAWETGLTSITTDTFSVDKAQSDTLNLDSGITSVAANPIPAPNHLVSSGRFNTTLRPSTSVSPGYLTITWTFPEPVKAFGADFYSIGGSRKVSVQGDFDGGQEAFDLRTLFINDGGLDQGFFGLKSTTAFSSITLIALGTSTNDNFEVDNVSFSTVPEPSSVLMLGLGSAVMISRRKK